ncbi:MAG: S1 RNA-binding domain-containing protein, partial [Mariprofundaceae bacterium]
MSDPMDATKQAEMHRDEKEAATEQAEAPASEDEARLAAAGEALDAGDATSEAAPDAGQAEEAQAGAEGSEEDEFRALFEASLAEAPVLRRGEMVRGVVLAVGPEVVLVDVGAKAEGVIPVAEFSRAGLPLPRQGDEIGALVTDIGGDAIALSVLAARKNEAWEAVEQALAEG